MLIKPEPTLFSLRDNVSNLNLHLGNEFLHLLTSKTQHLRIDLQRFTGEKGHAKYSRFAVGDENNKYKLMVSGFRGTIGGI
jgi:hypothetical protein